VRRGRSTMARGAAQGHNGHLDLRIPVPAPRGGPFDLRRLRAAPRGKPTAPRREPPRRRSNCPPRGAGQTLRGADFPTWQINRRPSRASSRFAGQLRAGPGPTVRPGWVDGHGAAKARVAVSIPGRSLYRCLATNRDTNPASGPLMNWGAPDPPG